jgi:Multidrug resistance efflux pump
MSKVLGFFKKNRTLTIVIASVLVVVILIAIFNPGSGSTTGVVFPDVYTLTRMDLEKVVPATGSVESVTSRQVNVNTMNQVDEIYVKEGEYVEEDKLLALLDTTSVDRQISDLNVSINDMKKKISDAEAALTNAKNERKAVETIQQSNVNKTKLVFEAAKATYAAKEAAMQDAKRAWDADPTNTALQDAYEDAKNACEKEYTDVFAPAQAAYDAAVAKQTAEMAQQDALVKAAQGTLDALNESLKTLNTQMTSLQRTRSDCYIKAPIAGTITSIGVKVGGVPSSMSPMFLIEDLTKLQVKVQVPEYDVLSIKLGQDVTINSDADSKSSWTGKVTAISPVATDIEHNFTVTIEITSVLGSLTSGMSAKVNIICEKKQDVFAVPYDAVVTNSSGKKVIYAVELIESGDTKGTGKTNNAEMFDTENRREIVVETGMEADYYIEIISSSIHEGMYILSDPENRNASTGGSLFSFGA